MIRSVVDAKSEAEAYLAGHLPRRWSHVAEVARRASCAGLPDEEAACLTQAAWLHDIGYAAPLARTGFHPLDGARFLQRARASERVIGLVAFHSSAASEALTFGVATELYEFKDEQTRTRDLLWYFDMTTGPDGARLSFEERMNEIRERYSADHYVIRALDLGMAERVAAVERATAWLCSMGLDHV